MQTLKTKLSLLPLAALMAFVMAGCDLQENADLENGREKFIAQCGTCHILAEAGTTADVGPDMDAAFAAARAAGMDQDTIEGVVEYQIRNPRLTDVDDPTYMPAELVEGEDLRDVSAYVAAVAGVPGIEPPEAPGGPGGQVYANNGCGACHILAAAQSQGNVGPNLDDVLPGQTAAMIENSILNPNDDLTPGFSAGIMPENYGETISPEDLELLVEFLAESAGNGGDAADAGDGGS